MASKRRKAKTKAKAKSKAARSKAARRRVSIKTVQIAKADAVVRVKVPAGTDPVVHQVGNTIEVVPVRRKLRWWEYFTT